MKALITGINGFAGSFLAEHLLSKNWIVSGTVQPNTSTENLLNIANSLQLLNVDLLDINLLSESIKKSDLDVVFHLAGLSSVRTSFLEPVKYFEANVIGTINLFEVVKKYKPGSRVVVVTSSEVYGESLDKGELVDEDAPLLPKSPYAASKASVDMLSRMYSKTCGINVIIARPASHIGPRQTDVFFIPTIARQIAQIIKERKEPELLVGNIDIRRDFLDVRDVVLAYTLLAEKGKRGEAYNICSGKKYFLRDLICRLIKISGKNITVKVDPDRLRKTDLKDMGLNNSKLIAETGWRQMHDIENTLENTLDYWLNKVA